MTVLQFPGKPANTDDTQTTHLGTMRYVAKLGEVLTQEQHAKLERRREEIERQARERL